MRKTRITILAILFLLTIFFVATAEGDGWTKEGDYLCYYENGNRLVGTQFVFNQMYNFTQEGYLQSDGNVQRLTNGSATCKITVK